MGACNPVLTYRWANDRAKEETFVFARCPHGKRNSTASGDGFFIACQWPLCMHNFLPMLDQSPMSSEKFQEPRFDFLQFAACYKPLVGEVIAYLVDSPLDLFTFVLAASKSFADLFEDDLNESWHELYRRRWPAFEECLAYAGQYNWAHRFGETQAGYREFILEVFDREKRQGFAMAAMSAQVRYDEESSCYIAKYLSAGVVRPEHIPVTDSHRFRFCPPSARDKFRLKGNMESPEAVFESASKAKEMVDDHLRYPYRVLDGVGDLRVGEGVELQWKMQRGSPFGWWYGKLEAFERDQDGPLATATIIFLHFRPGSRWYRLTITFGDSQVRPCAFGGYTGGVRATTQEEAQHWQRFFPRETIDL